MGLLDEIEQQAKRRETDCRVAKIAKSLPESDAADLLKACDDPMTPYLAIVRALKNRGISIADVTIRRHRLKGCTCESR
jgi:hypothetical protein